MPQAEHEAHKVGEHDSPAAAGAAPGDKGADQDLQPLVHRAQNGDEAAFTALYRRLQPVLLAYLRGVVGDDAEDVAADAWLVIARDLGRFRGDGSSFRGWTVTVARRRALDLLRRERRRPQGVLLDEGIHNLPAERAAEEHALESLGTRQVLGLISTLPRDQAEAVLLRTVAGMRATDAGAVLGKRPGAVRTAAHRGLRQLAELVTSASWRERSLELAAPAAAEGRGPAAGAEEQAKLGLGA
ncbi:sigma-70 family RNA polymerase sigma factor [Streptomyces sp. WMMC500]|uniref:RNA polymerase sigma factor n=1 Tax=Streptomyces sp. WMMC500 TaxID=3015154 RepID=UPI00248B9FBC|nr:sigma-70 family RNA polymerase sigma factor [Streptomyces sp. WMMC500]WBB63591.1 sigma-70 family RNA polymerase sigma factor [Streptomyces sp. WMMC500]